MNQGVSWGGILVLLIFIFIPCAAFLAIFFAPFLIDKTIASPIGHIFTGNPNIIEDKPIYGPVKANRNQGDYRQALNLVEAQLKKHPFDFDGLMLKAAIHAEDYHDNYYNNNKNQPYCIYVIKPKLDKLKKDGIID